MAENRSNEGQVDNEINNAEKGEVKKPTACELFIQFVGGTSIHGVRFVIDRNVVPLRRIMWLLIVLTCAGFFGKQLYSRAVYFMSNPTTVSFDIVYNKTLRFPDVLLCNNNIMKTTRTSPYDYPIIETIYSEPPSQETVEKLVSYWQQSIIGVNNSNDYIDMLHRIEDMLIECNFRGATCSVANFTYLMTDSGPCYKFSVTESSWDVSSSGVDNGLSLLINLEQYAYGYGPRETVGMQLLVKDAKEMPLMKDQSILIPAGGQTQIGLQVSTINDLPAPWGRCGSRLLTYYPQYSKSACWLECLTNYTYHQCSCIVDFMPAQLESCDLIRYYNCALPIQKRFSQLNEIDSCNCPPSCHELTYQPTITFAAFSDFMAGRIAKKLRVQQGETLLQDIIFAKDITTLHFDETRTSTDIEMLTSALAAPLANFVATAEPFNQDVLTLISDIQQLQAGIFVTSSSPSLAAISNVVAKLGALKTSLETFDRTFNTPTLNSSLTKTTYEQTVDRLTTILSLKGRTTTLRLFVANGTFSQAMVSMLNTVTEIPNQVADELSSIYSDLSSTISADKQLALSAWWQSVSPVVSRLRMKADMLIPVLNQVLNGFVPLCAYAKETVPHLGLDIIDESFVQKNLLRVDVFFKEMRYSKMTKQISDSMTNLVCDIGGTFGLCLGASIMSVYELIDFGISLFFLRHNTVFDG